MLDPRLVTFAALAAGTFASEDLACITAGLLVASGQTDWLTAVTACAAGIFVGDVGLYLMGRLVPARATRWQTARSWFNRFGNSAVFLSRFMPGSRVATYLTAGALRMPFARFASYLGVAVISWTLLLVGVTAWFGQAPQLLWLAVPALAMVTLRHTRWSRWEFWPVWLAYLPLAPYLLWLGVRHRSFILFRQTNPGMKNGGLVGESKSESLRHLRAGAPSHVPPFVLATRIAEAQAFVTAYPVVLKPDIGERGDGVAVIRNAAELDLYFAAAVRPTIVQHYVGGEEFGLFYERDPHSPYGELTSITTKQFPSVTGDGRSTIEQLVRAGERSSLIAHAYRNSCRRPFDSVPAAGETVPLVEIGSHCRGTVFLDGRHLWTPPLAAAVDRVAQTHPGFYFGRFDVRAASAEALQQGEFQVLELNGVGAEPAHIYDPKVSLWDAYRALFRHWRKAFAIGAANRRNAS